MTAADFTPLKTFGATPEGWLWGTATAAHQIEGGNVNNDWWQWEHHPETRCKESSGDACDSWLRWREDLALVAELGLDSYRFSLEWSRIEPADGEFSVAALAHYREMLVEAKRLGLTTCVTFHHFTTPTWMAERGGWENPDIVAKFARYCAAAGDALGDLIDIACTINEANVPGLVGYIAGEFTPGRVDDFEAFATVQRNFAAAHVAARDVLREARGEFAIGMTLAVTDQVIHPDNSIDSPGLRPGPELDALAAQPGHERAREWLYLFTGIFFEVTDGDDFLGVQTYFTQHMGVEGQPLDLPEGTRTTQMGWTFTPEALGHTVRHAAAVTGLPIYVTENGVATTDCDERIEYYSRSLAALREAMDDGVDVRGFFAWSLLDNFEWAHGYGPKFGLVEVDRTTFARTVKKSGRWYAELVAASR